MIIHLGRQSPGRRIRPTRKSKLLSLKRAASIPKDTFPYLAFLHVEITAFHPGLTCSVPPDSSLWLSRKLLRVSLLERNPLRCQQADRKGGNYPLRYPMKLGLSSALRTVQSCDHPSALFRRIITDSMEDLKV